MTDTPHPLAALLAGVPRQPSGSTDPQKVYLLEADVLAALTLPDDEAGKVLEGVTEGPWRVDGELWNQIVWSGADNRVCFMAHSNGLDDDRDVATARFIAWCREGVPALLAQIAALRAENRKSAMDAVSAGCQAQEAWEAQKAAEAERDALRAALDNIATELTGVIPEPDNMRMAIDTAVSVARAALTTEADNDRQA